MTILQSLNEVALRLEERGELPPLGFSNEKISFSIELKADGTVVHVHDLRNPVGKKLAPRNLGVPQAIKRSSGIASNFLWDKTSYVLGVSAKESKRLADEHKAFVDKHLEALEEADDAGLLALKNFLQSWKPEDFRSSPWHDEMKDENLVFQLSDDEKRRFLHERPAARKLWENMNNGVDEKSGEAVCLVTGENATIERLHPAIKGVWGAQSSGASIVSFNAEAYSSYGHEQGENAPVSHSAALRYTGVLNQFLKRDSGHSVQIGDASTVFWATAQSEDIGEEELAEAEAAGGLFLGESSAEADEAEENKSKRAIAAILERLRNGERVREFNPRLAEGVRFHILGLAPNAARISIRFYLEDNFGVIADRYQDFMENMRIEPPPRQANPAMWQYLRELAVLGKRENVPPNLAGEWMRAILAGSPYPLMLLSNVLMRLRADGEVNAMRAAILRAVLIRNFKKDKEAQMAFDPENENKGYLLGRLFAVYEQIQSAAMGGNVNATIKDKFYGSASAQPRKVFSMLDSGSVNHLSRLRKDKPGYKVVLEKQLGEIMDKMSPDGDPYPIALSKQEQALFGLGYYHQRSEFFKKSNDKTESVEKAQ